MQEIKTLKKRSEWVKEKYGIHAEQLGRKNK